MGIRKKSTIPECIKFCNARWLCWSAPFITASSRLVVAASRVDVVSQAGLQIIAGRAQYSRNGARFHGRIVPSDEVVGTPAFTLLSDRQSVSAAQ